MTIGNFGIRFLVALMVVAFTASAFPAAAQQQAQYIAAIVNDSVISGRDLNSRIDLIIASSKLENSPENRNSISPHALRALIDENLKMQEAERLGVKATERDISRALVAMDRKNGLPPGGFLKEITQNGIPASAVMSQIKAEVTWNKLIRYKVIPKIKIGETETNQALADIKAVWTLPHYLPVEIFIPGAKPESRAMIERLAEQVRRGVPFSTLARNFSRSASAAVGGDLGWVVEGQLGGELNAAMAKLQPGQVSPPIRTEAGYYLLFLRKKRSGNQPDPDPGLATLTLSQLFTPIPTGASEEELAPMIRKIQAVAAQARGCGDLPALAKKLPSAAAGGLGTHKLNDLSDVFRKAVKDLPANRPSRPLLSSDGVIIVMVCRREAPPAPKPPTKEQIKRKLLSERANIHSRRYLRDIRRVAIVDIRR